MVRHKTKKVMHTPLLPLFFDRVHIIIPPSIDMHNFQLMSALNHMALEPGTVRNKPLANTHIDNASNTMLGRVDTLTAHWPTLWATSHILSYAQGLETIPVTIRTPFWRCRQQIGVAVCWQTLIARSQQIRGGHTRASALTTPMWQAARYCIDVNCIWI